MVTPLKGSNALPVERDVPKLRKDRIRNGVTLHFLPSLPPTIEQGARRLKNLQGGMVQKANAQIFPLPLGTI